MAFSEDLNTFLSSAEPETQIAEGVNIGDLVEFITEITDEELAAIDETEISPELLRNLIEKISLKTALAALQIPEAKGAAMSHVFDRDELVQLFAALMQSDGVTIHLSVE